MKYLKYNTLLLLTLVGFIAGCSDDFLDLKPIAKDTEETYYKDFNAVDNTVTAAYAELCAREVFDKDYYLAIGSIPADDVEAGGESINDYPDAQNFDRFIHTLNDASELEDIWRYCYKGLRFCNTALDKLATIKEVDPKASDELIARRVGEMKFMRAWYHFTLVQVFGGVPIADKTIQPSEFNNPRNSIIEVFDFIEQDLKDAIQVLPEKKNLGTQVGRATIGAAQALLAKTLMYESGYAKNYSGDERFTGCEQRWQEALTYAEAVINSTDNYKLVGANGERYHSWRTGTDNTATIDGYRWLFTADADNSSESIFEIQSVNDGLGWGVTRGNCMTVYQTCRKYLKEDGTLGDVGGWSFNSPTDYLIAAFQNSDSRESNLHSTPCNASDDPRFATTVGRVGDSILIDATTFRPMNLDNMPTGYIGRKFECGWDEYWSAGQWTQGPFNVRLIRLADILLLAAEAAIETNQTDKALDYVNRVRARARACGTTGYPQDLTSISFEDVVHERRLELACEPHRFFDLVRWGLTDKYLNGISNAAVGGDFRVEFVNEKHEFWPIPLSEIQLSKGGLVNYPAWQ